jgi:hypothetical protein
MKWWAKLCAALGLVPKAYAERDGWYLVRSDRESPFGKYIDVASGEPVSSKNCAAWYESAVFWRNEATVERELVKQRDLLLASKEQEINDLHKRYLVEIDDKDIALSIADSNVNALEETVVEMEQEICGLEARLAALTTPNKRPFCLFCDKGVHRGGEPYTVHSVIHKGCVPPTAPEGQEVASDAQETATE